MTNYGKGLRLKEKRKRRVQTFTQVSTSHSPDTRCRKSSLAYTVRPSLICLKPTQALTYRYIHFLNTETAHYLFIIAQFNRVDFILYQEGLLKWTPLNKR